MSPPPPPPLLTLDNFTNESEVPENCPFVLTSPRSLEACRRAGVQVTIIILSSSARIKSPKTSKLNGKFATTYNTRTLPQPRPGLVPVDLWMRLSSLSLIAALLSVDP